MKQFPMVVSSLVVLFATGCSSTPRIPDYQPASPSGSERTTQASGVEVAVDPFIERDRTEQYFGIDALAEGIAILHVRIVNKTADQTFLVEKKSFRLSLRGGQVSGSAESVKRERTGSDTVAKVGATLAWSPLFGTLALANASAMHQATEVRRNFVGKEMADQTLEPGQMMQGFIYYTPVQKREDWSRGASVLANIPDIRSNSRHELTIPLGN